MILRVNFGDLGLKSVLQDTYWGNCWLGKILEDFVWVDGSVVFGLGSKAGLQRFLKPSDYSVHSQAYGTQCLFTRQFPRDFGWRIVAFARKVAPPPGKT